MPNNEENVLNLDNFIKKSDIRENIINWYDFKEKANILFIGSDVYECLFKNDNKVTVLDVDKQLLETIEDRENLEKVNQDLTLFSSQCGKKFDYIIIMEAMNRLKDFIKVGKSTLKQFLELSYNILNNSGIILFSVANKFSIKNFSGATYNGGNSYDVLLGKEKSTAIYSKNEIIKILNESKFEKYNFYYPFPDHKLPSIVYSDKYLPNDNNSKLAYLVYYNPNDTIIFNEMEAIREIVKDGMLDYFSNSYLLEVSNSDENFSRVKFASYNNFRNKENKLITKMYDGYVQKEAIFEEGLNHIKKIEENIEILKKCNIDTADSIENNKVISKYQTLKTFNEYIGELVSQENIDLIKILIKKWYEIIYSSSMCMFCEKTMKNVNIFEKYGIIVDNNLKEKMHFLTDCLFDLTFENVFIDINENNEFEKFIVYDQEWNEKNAPVEFILYSSINVLYKKNSKISKYIKQEDLYNEFGITDFIDVFEKLDSTIQEKLLNKEIAQIYEKTYNALTTIEGIKQEVENEKGKFERLLKDVEKTNIKWQEHVDSLEKEIKNSKKPKYILKGLFKK